MHSITSLNGVNRPGRYDIHQNRPDHVGEHTRCWYSQEYRHRSSQKLCNQCQGLLQGRNAQHITQRTADAHGDEKKGTKPMRSQMEDRRNSGAFVMTSTPNSFAWYVDSKCSKQQTVPTLLCTITAECSRRSPHISQQKVHLP